MGAGDWGWAPLPPASACNSGFLGLCSPPPPLWVGRVGGEEERGTDQPGPGLTQRKPTRRGPTGVRGLRPHT